VIDITTLALFSVTWFLLTITPGPDMLYIATRSLSQGRNAGIVSALGVHTGILVHTLAAALGLSALIAASAIAFDIVKYAGAAYLVYLGVRTLFSKGTLLGVTATEQKPLWDIYRQGIVTNLLNPKIILFFTAFLPQFVDPSRGSVVVQLLLLGVLLVIIALPVDIAVGLLGGVVSNFFKHRKRAGSVGKWVTGTVFIGLGIGTALTSKGKS
jgi:threonine/homoserine/homoserine lactone efflux protein